MQNQTLSLSQSQHLQMVLAPQLRQSLEMLQVPIMELRAMIQEELEQNPTLEEKLPDQPNVEIESDKGVVDNKEELDFDKEFEVLAKLDDEWRDYFFQDKSARPYTSDDATKRQFMLDSLQQQESLQEHLVNQLALTGLSETDRQIGELIVGNIDDVGYLTTGLEELAASASFDLPHVEDVLSIIQDFHPSGVGARNLSECLMLQLDRLEKSETPAAEIVKHHLDLLGARKHNDIAKALHITLEEVQQAARLISTLDPKPGRLYSSETATYITPEVVVQKVDGEYVVVLNDDQLPHLKISKHYRQLVNDEATSPEVKSYIKERVKASAFLIKSIHQRQKTIYRIATEIVTTQKDFLDNGISDLKPLTMAEVAAIVGVHETTVSRAVASKYMKTPSGTFEMKYFFTPGIKTTDGKQISNKTVKDMIANMVANENPDKPLSDHELVEKLTEGGIKIARRTVAKYRLVLRIAPSHLRKDY